MVRGEGQEKSSTGFRTDNVRAIPSGGPHPFFVFVAALLALAASACYRVPVGKKAVSDVRVVGTQDIDEDALLESIATRESSRFLGLFEGVVFEYETFDEYALRKDLQRVERFLRSKGYYDAHVRAARVEERGEKVYVTIAVEQGEPVLVDSIAIGEKTPVDDRTRTALRNAILGVLPIGRRLEEDKFAESEAAALKGLTSTGHAAAKVTRQAEVDLATHRARLVYTVEPGPLGKFGPVRFEGLGELPVGQVRRIFGVEEGQRYSSEALADGRQALLDLGVFASIDVGEDLSSYDTTQTVPITVKAQPAKLRALLLGGGIELDALKTDGHLQVGWQSSNFFGGLRKLDLRYKPGIVFYPTRFPTLLPPDELLYEHRASATLSQPAFLEKRTSGLLRAEYNVFPVLLPKPTADVLGYHEVRGEAGLERTFWKRLLFVNTAYNLQSNFPFDYVGHIPEVSTLIVSYAQIVSSLDLRDNPKKPRSGLFFRNELQLAGGPMQGDADDVRVQPEIRAYVPLPRKVTLAFRGSVGFLFPFNYSEFAQINFRSRGSSRAEQSGRDYQLLYFRGFFGGGPASNRGYPIRAVGPHDYIPYLSPAGQSGECNPNDRACFLPTGGLSLWELNAEGRFVVSGPFSAALFCDSGDVSPFSVNIRPDRPHLSCGGGARYDTAVGPIRLDVGVRIPGMQYFGDAPDEIPPTPLFGVLPIAMALGIGEAF